MSWLMWALIVPVFLVVFYVVALVALVMEEVRDLLQRDMEAVK